MVTTPNARSLKNCTSTDCPTTNMSFVGGWSEALLPPHRHIFRPDGVAVVAVGLVHHATTVPRGEAPAGGARHAVLRRFDGGASSAASRSHRSGRYLRATWPGSNCSGSSPSLGGHATSAVRNHASTSPALARLTGAGQVDLRLPLQAPEITAQTRSAPCAPIQSCRREPIYCGER